MAEEAIDILTPEEAAVILRCHYKTILDLIHAGKLRASKFGTQRYRIQRSAIADCLKATEVFPEKADTEPVTETGLQLVARGPESEKVTPRNGGKPQSRYEKGKWWQELAGR